MSVAGKVALVSLYVLVIKYLLYTSIEPWLLWLSWLECCPVHQKAEGSVSSQGTYVVVGLIPDPGTSGKQPIDVSFFQAVKKRSLGEKCTHAHTYFCRYTCAFNDIELSLQ